MISDRGKKDDILWFTLFHEIAHLIKHGAKEVFVDSDDTEKNELEFEADEFSRNILIPPKEYNQFIETNKFLTEKIINDFSKKINVLPGIVVGRLQKDQYIHWNDFNSLIERL